MAHESMPMLSTGPDAAAARRPDEQLTVDPLDVPAQRPVVVTDTAVGEAVHLLEPELVGPDLGHHHASRGGAEVEGDAASHRRKAAATPASTGMCSPVVCVMFGPHSAKTALAQCSGSTSRLSSVRWA